MLSVIQGLKSKNFEFLHTGTEFMNDPQKLKTFTVTQRVNFLEKGSTRCNDDNLNQIEPSIYMRKASSRQGQKNFVRSSEVCDSWCSNW